MCIRQITHVCACASIGSILCVKIYSVDCWLYDVLWIESASRREHFIQSKMCNRSIIKYKLSYTYTYTYNIHTRASSQKFCVISSLSFPFHLCILCIAVDLCFFFSLRFFLFCFVVRKPVDNEIDSNRVVFPNSVGFFSDWSRCVELSLRLIPTKFIVELLVRIGPVCVQIAPLQFEMKKNKQTKKKICGPNLQASSKFTNHNLQFSIALIVYR